jgi:hypothetical protein
MGLDGNFCVRLISESVLTGVTAARWVSTKPRLDRAWQRYSLLAGKLDDLDRLRGPRPRAGSGTLAALSGALDTAVDVPPPPGDGGGAQKMLLGELAAAAAGDLQAVSELVAAVDEVWSVLLPRVGGLADRLSAASERDAGVSAASSRTAFARQALAAVQDRVFCDPLAVADKDVSDLEAAVAGVEQDVAAAVAAKAALAGTSAEARRRGAEIASEIDRAVAVQREASAKIVGGAGSDALDALRRRSAHLDDELERATAAGGDDWQQASRRVGELAAEQDELAADVARAAEAAGAGLAARQELRGRLEAYHAKAAVLGRVEDPEVDRLYRQAQAELYSAPCDLGAAEAYVRAYQAALTVPAGMQDRR